jgi:hypothetical protein
MEGRKDVGVEGFGSEKLSGLETTVHRVGVV